MNINRIKLSIINLIQNQTAVQKQLCKADAQKTEAPALFIHSQRKQSNWGINMFASQMNKLIGSTYPDGDVLHIDTLFKTVGCAV